MHLLCYIHNCTHPRFCNFRAVLIGPKQHAILPLPSHLVLNPVVSQDGQQLESCFRDLLLRDVLTCTQVGACFPLSSVTQLPNAGTKLARRQGFVRLTGMLRVELADGNRSSHRLYKCMSSSGPKAHWTTSSHCALTSTLQLNRHRRDVARWQSKLSTIMRASAHTAESRVPIEVPT